MKTKHVYMSIFLKLTVLIYLCAPGCSDLKKVDGDLYLIRVGDEVVTVLDYNTALEIAKTAYPHNVIQDPEAFKDVKLRLLNQMIEELILFAKARELNIVVTDEDVEAAVAGIKKDYPEGGFEDALLENAVSYNTWKKRLKVNLLMQRVITEELEDKVKITTEDIAAYYQKHYGSKAAGGEPIDEPENITEIIIKNLRRQKAEEAYKPWLKKIQKDYTIEINKELWQKIFIEQ